MGGKDNGGSFIIKVLYGTGAAVSLHFTQLEAFQDEMSEVQQPTDVTNLYLFIFLFWWNNETNAHVQYQASYWHKQILCCVRWMTRQPIVQEADLEYTLTVK